MCPEVNATGPWWLLNIGSGNGLVLSGIKPLPEPMLTQIYIAIWHITTWQRVNHTRARRFPLPDGPGQVKLPVWQVDLNRFFLFILYKQIEEFQNYWSRASDDFEKRQALLTSNVFNPSDAETSIYPENKMNPAYYSLVATALKLQQIPIFLHDISTRIWGHRWYSKVLC